jgi:hypothetical protein
VDAAHGSIQDHGDGTYTFTPADDYHASDIPISFTVSDGTLTSDSTATVDVTAVADAATLSVQLGAPTVMAGQEFAADGSYAAWQDSGIGTHAFTAGSSYLDGDGKLDLSAANGVVGDESGRTSEGIGVTNTTSGGQARYQIEHGNGESEALALDLNGPVSTAQVTLSRIYGQEGGQGEDARYTLFDADGNQVGSGYVDSSASANSGYQVDLTLTADQSFQYVVFEATADNGYSGSDFKIQSIAYTTDATIEYPLDVDVALADTDGSERLTITIDGLPDGASLSAGTDNGDGSWSIAEDQIDGLTLSVTDALDTGFQLTVNATTTDAGGDTETVSASVDIEPLGIVSGTDAQDRLPGTDGADLLQAGDGNDKVGGFGGNDLVDGGAGDDTLYGGAGDDTLVGGEGDDWASGQDGNDTYIFNPFEGNDTFQGGSGGGWTDTIQLNADADPNADPENPWTIEVDGNQVQYDLAAHALELNPDTSGVITLSDGSELTFDGIEKIEW